MRKITFQLYFLLITTCSYSQALSDKFEHLHETKIFIHTPNWRFPGKPSPATMGNAEVHDQLNKYLNDAGKNGWELVQREYSIQTIGVIVESSNSDTRQDQLTVIASFKKRIYSVGNEIEIRVAEYSKKYADSIRVDVISEISKQTWSQMGKFYKDDIVDELLKKITILLEAMKQKIIVDLKKP